MKRIQGYGWLIVGVVAGAMAALFPATVVQATSAAAGSLAGWQRAALGLLVFGCFAALYFRAHWIATLAAIRERDQMLAATRTRLLEAAEGAERSAFVLGDNLREIQGDGPQAMRRLYLEGARAHAGKLDETLALIRILANRLGESQKADD